MLPELRRIVRTAVVEGIEPALAARLKMQGFEQILDRRIVCGETHKDDTEPAEELPHEPGRPPVGEIGSAEIRARNHELVAEGLPIVLVDAAVQMDDPAELPLVQRVRQTGRRMLRQTCPAFLKQPVKVGSDQPDYAGLVGRQVEHGAVCIESVTVLRPQGFGHGVPHVMRPELSLEQPEYPVGCDQAANAGNCRSRRLGDTLRCLEELSSRTFSGRAELVDHLLREAVEVRQTCRLLRNACATKENYVALVARNDKLFRYIGAARNEPHSSP